jgi:hypothetical protein
MRLTPHEIRVVVFILVALTVGALVKNYRARHRLALPPAAKITPSPKAPVDFE